MVQFGYLFKKRMHFVILHEIIESAGILWLRSHLSVPVKVCVYLYMHVPIRFFVFVHEKVRSIQYFFTRNTWQRQTHLHVNNKT